MNAKRTKNVEASRRDRSGEIRLDLRRGVKVRTSHRNNNVTLLNPLPRARWCIRSRYDGCFTDPLGRSVDRADVDKEQRLPAAAPAVPSMTADKKADANMIEAKEAAIVATRSAAEEVAGTKQSS